MFFVGALLATRYRRSGTLLFWTLEWKENCPEQFELQTFPEENAGWFLAGVVGDLDTHAVQNKTMKS